MEMSRPTRLRRPPAKYAKEENPPKAEAKPSVPPIPKKNNEKVKNDPLNALRSPVLRDRTNLTVELVKIDAKKAIDDKDPSKMPKDLKKSRKRVQNIKSPEKPGNSAKIIKNSDDKLKKIVKRQLPPRSSKNPGIQVTEEEPKESPDVDKQSKVPKSSKIPQKNDLSKKNPSKTSKTSSKTPKSTKPSLPINKPPKSPAKSPKKSEKRSSKRLATKSIETSPKKSEKKFFKARKNVPPTHSKVSPMKRALKNPRKLKPKKKSDSYQPTLKESFAKAKKILRPRKIDKNYNENSRIIKNKELIDNNEERKGPVYKNLKIQEESPKDANKIYEFSFDVNDSNERLKKKRKKRIVRKTGIKRKKLTETPRIPDKITENKVEAAEVEVAEVLRPKLRINIGESKIKETPHEIDDNNLNNEVNDELTRQTSVNSLPRSPAMIEVVAEVHEAPPSPEKSSRPKIVSNKKLEGENMINLTSTPLNRKTNEISSSNPFSNRPSSQYKGMINHSLIRRSFSPIVKEASEKFDASSPWRPVSSGFSRIKNIYQSTPQGKKYLTPHVINSLATDNKRITKIKESQAEGNDENDNSKVICANSGAKSPRKFGTVLSNVSSGSSQSPTMFRGFDNSRKFSGDEENENKSPKKSPKKIKTKGFNEETEAREVKILRQSNLNNFLNIPGMPESTTIVTSHGIFDDPHSTPITGKTKRVEDFTVGNAFGFDVESVIDFSPTDGKKSGVSGNFKKANAEIQAKVEPTRLPVKEVKTTEVSGEGQREEEKVEEGGRMKKHAEATKTDVVEAVHFLDTFDADERETSPVEVPLFVDPEPVHFRQPPRYSYSKRKRAVKFNTSDETEHSDAFDSDDNENYVKHKNKKRKMTKAEKEQKKQLDEWAKSVNQTFEEIEHFDLLVE